MRVMEPGLKAELCLAVDMVSEFVVGWGLREGVGGSWLCFLGLEVVVLVPRS